MEKNKDEVKAEEVLNEDQEENQEAEEALEEESEEAGATEDTDDDKSDAEGDRGEENDEGAKKEDQRDKKIAELNDKVVRQMAEFDNFRKRTEKEKSEMFGNGEKTVIEAILPVIDNFERALDMAAEDEEKKDDPFIEGMDKVYKQLMDALEKLGVKPIAALGEDFDPNLHNAVMQEDTEEYESGKVCKELQKGYTLTDSVIRHSMVSVAK